MEVRVKYAPTGANVRLVRDERFLTQKEAAAEIGIAVRTLQNWEAGNATPRAKHKRAIDAWLNRNGEQP